MDLTACIWLWHRLAGDTVQTFNSCTNRPDVCQCPVVQTPMNNMSENKPSTQVTYVAYESKLRSVVRSSTLWGQMGPNCQVESICGHIFVRHFHILIIFDHMIANRDTKKLINPNDLDWPWMTLKWHKKTFFISISLFQSHFLPKIVW